MEPASSSEDDSSIEQVPSRKIIPRDDDSDSDGADSSSVPSSSDDEDDDDSSVEETETKNPQDFNDLPSEDSCMEDSSDDEDDEDGKEEEDEEDVPLAERIYAKRNNGAQGRARSAADKKSKALELAQKRLLEMKRKKNKKRKHNDSESSDSGSDSNSDSDSDVETSTSRSHPKKKKSKHAPTVASSSRSAFYKRGAPDLNSSGIGVEIGANKYKARDPRMQSLSGHFDQNVFDKRYDFLETMQDEEIKKLKQKCKAWKTTGRKGQKIRRKLGMTGGNTAEEDEAELKRLMQERASRRDAKIRSAAKSAVKKKLREGVAAGKRGVYYLKKRDMKKLELEAKFDQLRKVGGDSAVNKVLAKRRKRKMGKDSSLMPDASR